MSPEIGLQRCPPPLQVYFLCYCVLVERKGKLLFLTDDEQQSIHYFDSPTDLVRLRYNLARLWIEFQLAAGKTRAQEIEGLLSSAEVMLARQKIERHGEVLIKMASEAITYWAEEIINGQ